MAEVKVVNKGQTGNTAATTLAITSAIAGNTLYAFVSQISSVVAPTVTDNLGGTWTVEATDGETNTTTNSVWFAWKVAAGGETEIKATPGTGGTGEGILYLEASGAEAVEHILATGKQASALTHESPAITAASGDLIFIASAYGGANGEPESWNNGMTLVATGNARQNGGYLVTTEALTAKVFTLTLKVTKSCGLLAVAIKAAGGQSFSGAIEQQVAFRQTVAGSKSASGSVVQSMAFQRSMTGLKSASGKVVQSMAWRQPTGGFKSAAGAVSQSMAFRPVASGFKSAGAAVKQAFAFAHQLASVLVLEGAISQVFAFRHNVTGFKTAAGGVTQKLAYRQSQKGFKTALGSVKQSLAMRNVAAGFKSVVGAVVQRFGFLHTLTTGTPKVEVRVFASMVPGAQIPASVNVGQGITAVIGGPPVFATVVPLGIDD